MNHKQEKVRINKKKLAYDIAKRVKEYLNELAVSGRQN
jgi:hypothetical protein